MKRAAAVLFLVTVGICGLAAGTTTPRERLAWLGMGVRPIRDKSGQRLLHVERVTPAGPADRAGLRPGDLITEFGGAALQVGDDLDFLMFVAEHKPKDRLPVTFVRYGVMNKVMIIFGEMPESARAAWYSGLEAAKIRRRAREH